MKVFLETFGCQMNLYDSELLSSILNRHAYELTMDINDAQIVLLNTCAIREHAQQKIYNRLNELKKHKQKGRLRTIGVVGCMAQSMRKDLAEIAPVVDVVAGPDSYKKLPALLESATNASEKQYDFSLSEYETYSDVVPQRLPGINAWIAIMRGCNNFCTFCVVPYTRGRERSRSPVSIELEARQIVEQQFKQITLLGQNVNSYRYESYDFADLMQRIAQIKNLRRVRFTSPHPKDFSHRLLRVMTQYPNLCRHIHLPLQSGSDEILTRMNRLYSRRDFVELTKEIRRVLPDVALTTDIICGFCGETERDFAATVAVMEEVQFDAAFIFKYSERKNTIARRKYPDDVQEEIKTARVVMLNELQRNISKQRNQEQVGKFFEILIENPSKKNVREWLGRTQHNRGVVFSAPNNKVGDFVVVRITSATTNTLRGELVTTI